MGVLVAQQLTERGVCSLATQRATCVVESEPDVIRCDFVGATSMFSALSACHLAPSHD
jgi:hypothetical protein